MNQNIRKVLDAIESLRDVQGCELEVVSLSHKVQAMYSQGKDGLDGIAFIDACSDDELEAAIRQHDPRVKLTPFIDPFTFNYLRRNRAKALYAANHVKQRSPTD